MSDSPMTLYYHPMTRAATVVWMLEEVEQPYNLEVVQLSAGGQKTPEMLAKNPMGKVPVLVDGDALVSEVAAIGLYLADRYAPGRLAPDLTDPRRATYFRWSIFPSAVVEISAYAQSAKWEYRESSAGWGNHASVLDTVESAIGDGPWLLGEQFTMADVIFGATLRFMLLFKMIEERESFLSYVKRLSTRPAEQRAEAVNAKWREKLGPLV